jgi:hypothetical protein
MYPYPTATAQASQMDLIVTTAISALKWTNVMAEGVRARSSALPTTPPAREIATRSLAFVTCPYLAATVQAGQMVNHVTMAIPALDWTNAKEASAMDSPIAATTTISARRAAT